MRSKDIQPVEIGTLLSHAYSYAQLGLDIFPVNPQTKAPLHTQLEATCNLDTIEVWWKQWPQALIGHRISPLHIILDIDPRHGGLDTWKELKKSFPGVETRVHFSGRGDGGGHVWFQRPADNLKIARLDQWARERKVGHETDGGRWTSGIDLLQHDHRYTILPPSPHPTTAKPYYWAPQRGIEAGVLPLPELLCDLLIPDEPVVLSLPPTKPSSPATSIADWYSESTSWNELLQRHGWTLVGGDGDRDGSRWRHRDATAAHSATIRYGCLFVYSSSTSFESTAPGDVHGYTRFHALAVLEHGGDQSAAARAARVLKGSDPKHLVARSVSVTRQVDPETGEIVIETTTPNAGSSKRPFKRRSLDLRTRPIPKETNGCYLYRGSLTVVQSEPGVGKTWLACAEIVTVMEAGFNVLYFDEEGGDDLMMERLWALGASHDLIAQHLWYFPFESRLWEDDDITALMELVEEAGQDAQVSLAVFDSLPDFLAAADLSEDKAQDVTMFINKVIGVLRGAGISTMLLDHVKKPETSGNGKRERSRYSRGSGAKLAKADVTILLEVASPFDAKTSGSLRLWKTKDRYGRLPLPKLGDPARVLTVEVSDGRVAIAPYVGPTLDWNGPTECMAAIVKILENPASPELGVNQLKKVVAFGKDTVNDALSQLAKDGALAWRPGPRSSILYRLSEEGFTQPQEVVDELF